MVALDLGPTQSITGSDVKGEGGQESRNENNHTLA